MKEKRPRRKLTTILCADCVGYSRMMRADEERTYQRLQACRQRIDRLIYEHQGRIFGSAGDNVVAEFASPVEAVRAAMNIQREIDESETAHAENQRMSFRIGINLGDVMIEDDDLFGDGVNIASRLQALAEPGGICISASVYEQVKNKLALDIDELGDQMVKNIADPVRTYRVLREPRSASFSWIRLLHSGRLAGAGVLALLCLVVLAIHFQLVSIPWGNSAQCNHASIAVLPFVNLSGDPGQDYYSDGTTEDIIAALGRFSDLSVIAPVAVQQYKGKPVRPSELKRDLGVCYALEGSVRKNGEQVVVATQLIDAVSGRLLWSDSIDGGLKDLFAVRDQITRNVAGRLAIKLQDIERQRAFKKPTDSLEAYDYVLRGRDFLARKTRSSNTEAWSLFKHAIELDADYASAYVGLGLTRLNAAVLGWTEFPDDALREAESFAQKAIDLDFDNAEAHRLLGNVYFNRVQFDLATEEYDRAILLNPNDAAGYAARGSILVFTGHSKEALDSFDIAKRLNPSMGSGRLEPVGWAYYLERRYEEAITELKAGLRTGPDDYFIYAGLAASYAQLGREKEALRAAGEVRRVWPFFEVDKFAAQFEQESNRALVVEGLHKAGLN